MKIKISVLKKLALYTGIIIVIVILFVIGISNSNKINNENNYITDPVWPTPTIEGDKQILNLIAKWGYAPEIIEAKANMQTILKVETRTTFDCSSALTIPKVNINKNLPPTGFTEIEIPAQAAGTTLDGTCSMGMYSFKIKFT